RPHRSGAQLDRLDQVTRNCSHRLTAAAEAISASRVKLFRAKVLPLSDVLAASVQDSPLLVEYSSFTSTSSVLELDSGPGLAKTAPTLRHALFLSRSLQSIRGVVT